MRREKVPARSGQLDMGRASQARVGGWREGGCTVLYRSQTIACNAIHAARDPDKARHAGTSRALCQANRKPWPAFACSSSCVPTPARGRATSIAGGMAVEYCLGGAGSKGSESTRHAGPWVHLPGHPSRPGRVRLEREKKETGKSAKKAGKFGVSERGLESST